MGGFLYNGCGYADKSKNMRALGNHYCPICKEIRSFHLVEVIGKIFVVFIPTIPLSRKYAVVCDRCEQGQYISEEKKNQYLLMDGMPGSIFENGVLIDETQMERPALPQEQSRICPKCGHVQTHKGAFCSRCGTSLNEPPVANVIPPEVQQIEPPVANVTPIEARQVEPPVVNVTPIEAPQVEPPVANVTPPEARQVEPPISNATPSEVQQVEPPVANVAPPEAPQVEPPAANVAPPEAQSVEPPVAGVMPIEAPQVEPPVAGVMPIEAPQVEPPVANVTPPEAPLRKPEACICPKCGHKQTHKGAFCSRCGTSLKEQPVAGVKPPEMPRQPVQPVAGVVPSEILRQPVQPVVNVKPPEMSRQPVQPVANVPLPETPRQPAPITQVTICPVCGQTIQPGETACSICGTIVEV